MVDLSFKFYLVAQDPVDVGSMAILMSLLVFVPSDSVTVTTLS